MTAYMSWPLDDLQMLGLWFEAVGIFFTAFSLYSILRSRDSKSWMRTPASVIGAKLDQDSDGGYEAVITFHYSVEGRRYEKTDTFPSYPPTEERAERYLREYPAGREVTAYYDPHRHGDATLRPRHKFGDWVWLIAGMSCQVIGACLYFGLFG